MRSKKKEMTSLDDLDESVKQELTTVDMCVIGFGIGALVATLFMFAHILKGSEL
jgi:hypothetical protein